jgi:NADH-quinone oxidoreductase subunit J
MFSLAAMYVLLDAQFIGAIQVMVYAGAIMVVFLFVIMLLNLGHASEIADARTLGWKLLAGAVGLALLAQIAVVARTRIPAGATPGRLLREQVEREGAIAPVAGPLFREYLLAFEITSVLLLVAVVGAVVLAKRRDGTANSAGDAHAG